jgi:hypothetical protein
MTQNPASPKCFTIGYGDYPAELFTYFLQKTGIDTIVDVRTSPYSKYNYSFNRDNLEKFLNTHQISYLYMGDKMGGRYSSPNLLFPDGTVNYQKVRSTEKFKDGLNEVLLLISSGKRIALMCAEKEPEKCHRFALISRALQIQGVKVVHIRPEIKLQENEDLEKELVEKIIDHNQFRISDAPVNEIDTMYEKLNRSIAFKVKDFPRVGEEFSHYPEAHVPSSQKKNLCSPVSIGGNAGHPPSTISDIGSQDNLFTGSRHQKKEEQKTLF